MKDTIGLANEYVGVSKFKRIAQVQDRINLGS